MVKAVEIADRAPSRSPSTHQPVVTGSPARQRRRERFRRCVFTHQLKPTESRSDSEIADAMKLAGGNNIRYCVFQREMAPTTGQMHLQGYICFTKKMSLKGVKALKLFGRDPISWVEAALGSLKECVTYCTKVETRAAGCSPTEVSHNRGAFVCGTKQ